MTELTHIGPDGRTRMVDISTKTDSKRTAIAHGKLLMLPDTLMRATRGDTKKGDPIGIAELAGIMGAKHTSTLIPLCHPLPLTGITVSITPSKDADESALIVTATAKTTGKTGVEIEALTAVSVACLTLYDMLKAIDKTMIITSVELIEKTGGTSGPYRKPELYETRSL